MPHNSKVKSHLKFTELDINARQACTIYFLKILHVHLDGVVEAADEPEGLACGLPPTARALVPLSLGPDLWLLQQAEAEAALSPEVRGAEVTNTHSRGRQGAGPRAGGNLG